MWLHLILKGWLRLVGNYHNTATSAHFELSLAIILVKNKFKTKCKPQNFVINILFNKNERPKNFGINILIWKNFSKTNFSKTILVQKLKKKFVQK